MFVKIIHNKTVPVLPGKKEGNVRLYHPAATKISLNQVDQL